MSIESMVKTLYQPRARFKFEHTIPRLVASFKYVVDQLDGMQTILQLVNLVYRRIEIVLLRIAIRLDRLPLVQFRMIKAMAGVRRGLFPTHPDNAVLT